MEIHAPAKTPLTVREALVHLAIVTAGILIALSFDGMVNWWDHRSLVADTRERLTSEIRANQQSVQDVRKSLMPARQKLVHAIDVASNLTAPDHAKEAASIFGEGPSNVTSGISFAYFNTAAYTTAQTTGAFSFMDYDEALKYADTYDLQALYARLQDSTERDVIAAGMFGTSALRSPTPTEVEDMKRQLRLALGGILVLDSIAEKLNALYAKALTES